MEQNEIDFYQERIDKYPDDARRFGWTAQTNQEIRFKIIAQVMQMREDYRPLGSDDISITDFGCGDGSLFLTLAARGLGFRGLYFGIDAMQENIALGQRLAVDTLPNARFRWFSWDGLSKLPGPFADGSNSKPDYIVESGAFVKTPATKIPGMVGRLVKQAKVGFIGNFLMPSTLDDDNDGLTRIKPKYLLRFFENEFYALILLSNYMSHDFTLGIFHRDTMMEEEGLTKY